MQAYWLIVARGIKQLSKRHQRTSFKRALCSLKVELPVSLDQKRSIFPLICLREFGTQHTPQPQPTKTMYLWQKNCSRTTQQATQNKPKPNYNTKTKPTCATPKKTTTTQRKKYSLRISEGTING
jgi:hypothetical protein